MRLFVLGVMLFGSTQFAWGEGLPLTTKQVSLMLRSGYSSETVMRELATHHFGDSFDSTVESQLIKAGASPALLNAMRSGSFQASPAEIAAAEEKLAAQEEALAHAQEAASPASKPSSHTGSRTPNQSSASSSVNVVYQHLKGDLVEARQGAITHFDDEALEQKRFFLFFFSANWDPAGRKFTSTLVDYYKRIESQHPEFEVIFFSADRSQFGMQTYLQQNNMPWPAVAYDKIPEKAAVIEMKNIQNIPCLILVDSSGKIWAKTGDGKTPDDVLAEIDRILHGAKPDKVARTH